MVLLSVQIGSREHCRTAHRSLLLRVMVVHPITPVAAAIVGGVALQPLRKARNNTLPVGRRVCGMIGRLDLDDIGDSNETLPLQLF